MDNRDVTRASSEQLSLFSISAGGRIAGLHRIENDELFCRLVSIENLFLAWDRFCKGKRRRQDVMVFARHLEDNLFSLQVELASGSYRHSPYEPFVIHDPKQRTIHKANVKDRVIHQAIVNVIEPIFERRFICDSYSCRVGKGTHAAVKRLRVFLRQASRNKTKTIYALKCDIRKFFASVNHQKLLHLLERHIHDPETIKLLAGVIESFSVSPGVGIPLGNLTSQLFANVYLHELDWYVKQELKVRYYVRYCDDFVLLAESPEECGVLTEQIETFLNNHLHMHLHPNKVHVRTWKQGVDFLGYILLPHATILRPSTERRALRNATTDNVSSYLGLCKHADAYLLESMIRNMTSV